MQHGASFLDLGLSQAKIGLNMVGSWMRIEG